jgi:hypothetical protein
VTRYAAMGAEPRLGILRLLVSADPDGMVAGDIQAELAIPSSTRHNTFSSTCRLPPPRTAAAAVGRGRRLGTCPKMGGCRAGC